MPLFCSMIQAIGILAPETTAAEIRTKGWNESVGISWAESFAALTSLNADAYFDLDFSISHERIKSLEALDRPVFISSMDIPLGEISASFIRINCWPGMLQRPLIEVAIDTETGRSKALDVLNALNWKYQLAPDIPGFISARILATVINEAYFTLQAGVSSEEEIDIAMKLGTNYPIGPFEWGKKIGISNIVRLLQRMSIEDRRYLPAALLNKLL